MNSKEVGNENAEKQPTSWETWMDEARQMAAQCWCCEDTSHIVMEPALAEAVARLVSGWIEDCAQGHRNTEYYRGLVERCGRAIGEAAYIADDGGRNEDVLCAKVPELVEQLAQSAALISSGESKPTEPSVSSPESSSESCGVAPQGERE